MTKKVFKIKCHQVKNKRDFIKKPYIRKKIT